MRSEPTYPSAAGPAEAVAAVVRAVAGADRPDAALRAGLRAVVEALGADAAAVSRGEEFVAAEGWGDGPPTGQLLADAGHAVPLPGGKLLVSRPAAPLLAALGCALGQGFHYARPTGPAAATAALADAARGVGWRLRA